MWQDSAKPRRFYFVDESGFAPGLRLAYGYSKRGERCRDSAPFRTGKRMSLLGWISSRGSGLISTYTGTVNHTVFECFVEEKLAPAIVAGDPPSTDGGVLWDNATTHSQAARLMIAAAGGEVVPLPRYSPDINPMSRSHEISLMLWSQLKHKVRGRRPDTVERLRAALEEAVHEVTGDDILAYARHCGFKIHLS